ncbi:MAG: arginase [Patescibacteria group bacterium]|nr:arginase [Patescibacteria group bacterium]
MRPHYKNATVIGIPLDLGTQRIGVDMGPNALRYEKIIERLEGVGIRVNDFGNIDCNFSKNINPGNTKLKYLKEISKVSDQTAKAVDKLLQKKEKIVALGGDHSMSIGTVSGASKFFQGDLGLIYLDTHGDLNTDKTTTTGNIHGMSLAVLLAAFILELINIYAAGPKIKKDNLLLIGAKDLDLAEEELIKKENIKSFDITDVLAHGLSPLFEMIDKLQARVKNIWVSLDLDVIDNVYAPGVGIANDGGLTYREIVAIAKYIGRHCNVIGLDIVEYNPIRDIDHKTADLSIALIAKLLGSDYSRYTEYMDVHKIT